MKRKRFKAEQIIVMLRKAEIQMSKGLDANEVCYNLEIFDTLLEAKVLAEPLEERI